MPWSVQILNDNHGVGFFADSRCNLSEGSPYGRIFAVSDLDLKLFTGKVDGMVPSDCVVS